MKTEIKKKKRDWLKITSRTMTVFLVISLIASVINFHYHPEIYRLADLILVITNALLLGIDVGTYVERKESRIRIAFAERIARNWENYYWITREELADANLKYYASQPRVPETKLPDARPI